MSGKYPTDPARRQILQCADIGPRSGRPVNDQISGRMIVKEAPDTFARLRATAVPP